MTADPPFEPGPSALALAARAHRHDHPPEARDAAAAAELFAMLVDEARVLASLRVPVTAVAAAPAKFNDVSWGQWWLARAGDAIAEADSYFTTRADYDEQLRRGDPALQTAGAVLERLERRGWRQTWLRAYELPLHEEFLALIVQDGAPWFLYATSNSGDRYHAFALWQAPSLVYVGECIERMDDELSTPGPKPLALLVDRRYDDDDDDE